MSRLKLRFRAGIPYFPRSQIASDSPCSNCAGPFESQPQIRKTMRWKFNLQTLWPCLTEQRGETEFRESAYIPFPIFVNEYFSLNTFKANLEQYYNTADATASNNQWNCPNYKLKMPKCVHHEFHAYLQLNLHYLSTKSFTRKQSLA